MLDVIEKFKKARVVSTPLLAISTPDPQALTAALAEAVSGKAPTICWDRARGFTAVNDFSKRALQPLGIAPEQMPFRTCEPADAMRIAEALPADTVLVAWNMDRFLREPQGSCGVVVQAVCNLREAFKDNKRTLVMLDQDFDLPRELRHDVILLEDPLPDEATYSEIVRNLYAAASLKEPAQDVTAKAVLAVRGLSHFEAEQVLAMSLKKTGLDLAMAWELKQRAIGKVKGLTMTLTGPSLDDLRGQDAIIGMLKARFAGPDPPLVVVLVDEIDKSFAGLGTKGGPGDNTGVTQDLHQNFLTNMESRGWDGVIIVGLRGSGKTALTESIGSHYGIPTIKMDTGAMKAKHVGESEQAHREAFRAIGSIGGSRVLVMATCNKLDVLPPELLRRFKLQIWYVDLLTKPEREALWPIYLKKYGHPADSERPDDDQWTGAEIRNCCEVAYKLRLTVKQVGEEYIVPITRSDPQSIEDLRTTAEGRFLSASFKGAYHREQAVSAPTGRRKIAFGKES